MPNTRPRMRLSHEEEVFLRHWIHDEAHYQESPGPAKALQLRNRVISADLAKLIAAAIPDLEDQEAAGSGPPPAEPPVWPWSEGEFRSRLAEARSILGGYRTEDARRKVRDV